MRAAAFIVVLAACTGARAVQLFMAGAVHPLRPHAKRSRPSSPDAPPVMVLALDGVSRDQLYAMLRAGELPNLAALVGGDGFSHAYFDDSFLSVLPSTTMAAWVSAFTGATPAEHGVTGNEYFVRETKRFESPSPVSFKDRNPTLALYDEEYLDTLYRTPNVYERMRAKDRDILIWVSMSPIFRGADEMLFTKRDYVASAAGNLLEQTTRGYYADMDSSALAALSDHLKTGTLPDVLTVYLPGIDLDAHLAPEGPDRARRAYLRKVVDPPLGKIVRRLRDRGLLDRLWVIVTSDHGHTAVLHDAAHSLGINDGPRELLTHAGFRVRGFAHEVPRDDPFNAVLAYGGAMAYVYVADRSLCPGVGGPCSWQQPPRYEQDVLAAADAFYRANLDGTLAPQMKGTLDMVLTRVPKPAAEIDAPFEVYIGDGKTEPIDEYLAGHPHPTYVRFAERMYELAVGPRGERAGDVVLIAHNGDRERIADRFYFARLYHSWHGSPSRRDSEIPLIVANRHHDAQAIGTWARAQLGAEPLEEKLADLMLGLRDGALGQ